MRRAFVILLLVCMSVATNVLASETDLTCAAPGVPPSANAGTTSVAVGIDPAFHTPDGDFAVAGSEIRFRIAYLNYGTPHYNVANAWVLSSPDGAKWTTPLTGNFLEPQPGVIGIDTTHDFSMSQFNAGHFLKTYSAPSTSADGISPDTIVFIGSATDSLLGLKSGYYYGYAFYLHIKTDSADSNKSICLDSVMNVPPNNTWQWVSLSAPVGTVETPSWGGKRCINLVSQASMPYNPCAISLDGIDGAITTPFGDIFPAGGILKFNIRYTNESDSGFNVVNSWKIYSPEGATWTDSAKGGNFHGTNLGPIGVDTTGYLSKSQFPTVYSIRTFSSPTSTPILKADGLSPDTIAFQGGGADIGQGLLPHTDGRAFTFMVQTKLADTGKTICIDTTMRCPPT